jgi:hypothetical protein
MTRIVVLELLCCWIALSGCSSQPPDITTGAFLIRARITWKGYSGVESHDEAIYVFNNRTVGKGETGFDAILKELGNLEEGTTILIQPDYTMNMKDEPSDCERIMPFDYKDMHKRLDEVIAKRHLRVIYSPW